MGPKLLVLNRISRHSAQAVLAIPRIGRKGHKSNCFMGISTSFSSPGGSDTVFRCSVFADFPVSLCLLELAGTDVLGLGLCSQGASGAAGACPGRCPPQTGCSGDCSEESRWSSAPSRTI